MAQWSEPLDSDGVTSAVKTLRVLEIVAESGGVSLSELLPATGLPKSSLLRILSSLVEEGFLERPAHGRYRPALKLWRLGCQAVDYENVRSEVIPILRELVAKTSMTAHYAVYHEGRSTYVDKVDGSDPIRAYTAVGSSSPAYATATGKALLSWQSEAETRRVLANAEKHTELTVTDVTDFLAEIKEAKRVGYAMNRGEWREGVGGIAAPILGRDHSVVAAIGVSGPAAHIIERHKEYGLVVVAAAAGLSARHGYFVHKDEPT